MLGFALTTSPGTTFVACFSSTSRRDQFLEFLDWMMASHGQPLQLLEINWIIATFINVT